MHAFTGAPTRTFFFENKGEEWKELLAAESRDYIMTAGTPPGSGGQKMDGHV